ncbi:ribonuclease P protein subunit [Geoglobus acetivorans]|uniref:Ribonuclease P protein component 1 n=1 Tax=Geoglobus acetivorans TaxID=565033 RepID=A0ABZ3H0Q6_GEOAI|nr:ribonuclease P protein subunit [Geoglobus acetivorans]
MLARDWIGLSVEVVESPNKFEAGLKGMVVDETMRTLKLKTENGLKTVAKEGRKFAVMVEGRRYLVDGSLISFRPEERIMRGMMLVSRMKG